MSNKLAPIVIPVIVDAAGIDRGMRTAKQKLASGLGGQGGTDFGGASGFGSGTRGGGGAMNSGAFKTAALTAIALRLTNTFKPAADRPKGFWPDDVSHTRMEERWKAYRSKQLGREYRKLGKVFNRDSIGTEGALVKAGNIVSKISRYQGGMLRDARNEALSRFGSTAAGLGVSTGALALGIGGGIAAAAVAGVAAVGSFRESVAGGASGLEQLGAKGSALNQSAMNIQAGYRSQPSNMGGMAARASAVAGEETSAAASWASMKLGTLFSAETVGGMAALVAAPFNNDTWMGPGGVNERYGNFIDQQYEAWRLGSYGTPEELRASRKEARRATRIAERNAI